MHSRTEKIDLNDLSRSMKRFDFSHMDLREKSFIGADLEFADFEGADLSFADFTAANLRCANLKKAKLYGTNFSCADLKFADMRGTDIERAGFENAEMDFADLSEAHIRHSHMRYASIFHTRFVNADLEDVDLFEAIADHADFEKSNIKDVSNPPFQAMCCPSHGAFTAWTVGHQESEEYGWLGAVIELVIPEDAIRISNYNGICRANKAIVKSICIVHTYDYAGAALYRTTNYEYVSEIPYVRAEYRKIEVGETLISDIDFNRFNGSKGIRFWLDKDVAIRSAYYMSEP